MHGLKDLLWHTCLSDLGSCVQHLVACCLGGPESHTALLYFQLRGPLKLSRLKGHPCRC